MVLIDELGRCGVQVLFVNHELRETPGLTAIYDTLRYATPMDTEPANQANSTLHTAVAALFEAEGRLREAAASAAASGEYDALVVITRWAKTVQSLASETNGALKTGSTPPAASESKAPEVRAPKIKLTAGTPVYSRDSDMLVKTARSRKSKSEYEHRAPADVVVTVAECLSDWRPNRKLLTGEQLLDAYARKKGAVVSYQVYAALGWFGQIGLVRRHGRSGYSVPQPNTIVGDVQKAWESLKNGRGQ